MARASSPDPAMVKRHPPSHERSRRRAFGDWQTPPDLAEAAVGRLSTLLRREPETIIEPACGSGVWLRAAARVFPRARILGYEIDAERAARSTRAGPEPFVVQTANSLAIDWVAELRAARDPVLALGNPPWVTSAALGRLGSTNAPAKANDARLPGYDALTGKSNFDISEWLMGRLLQALSGRDATLAMLCKATVARRLIQQVLGGAWPFGPGGVWRIGARKAFGAAVDAVFFVAQSGAPAAGGDWPEFPDLAATRASSFLSLRDAQLTADGERFDATRSLRGSCDPSWRSGMKHDCAQIMELTRENGALTNQLGEHVDLEPEVVFPLLKSSDLANRRMTPRRAVVVPHRDLRGGATTLPASAPRAWAYLQQHLGLFAARRSRVYVERGPFAVFGVGPYSFAPWKVAISGLYKRLTFVLVGPFEGRPVFFDDTCYFLPFDDEPTARLAWQALESPRARDYLEARIFWDCKRPIQKGVLQSLDLRALQHELGDRLSR